jgi:PAS domain S-box-containing protein
MIEHSYDEKESWTEIAFNPIWKQQEVVGIACTAIDITERKLFEKSLIKSQNRLKQAQEIAHVGNWDLDFKTKSARWSDEAYRIYGITPSNFDHTFESWLSFIHPEDFEDVKAKIDHGAQTLTDYSMYHRIIRPDGSIRYLYSETHFEFNNNGVPIGVHGISQDITDRRTNEIKLQELLKTSNDQNRWLHNFTHIVSHNIRSQNSNISGIVNLLDRDSSEYDQLISMLKDSTGKLHETISNLSEYIKLQTNPEKQYKTVNLHDEINKTCIGINQLINETGATVINDTDNELTMQLIPSFVESILLNLLTNAIKYRSSKRAPVIRLSNESVNSFQCLTVEDNGAGIDLKKHKDAIFGMYQTFHGNNDAVGFGLFITKNQIEAMAGKIEIDSTPDQGTKFKIYFHEKS